MNSKASRLKLLYTGCAIFNVLVFTAAIATKLVHVKIFYDTLDRLGIIPGFAIRPVAFAVIAAEILIVIGCFIPFLRKYALRLAMGLSVIFLIIEIWRIFSKIDSSCGCFGDLFVLSPVQSIFLVSSMLLSLIYCLFLFPALSRKPESLADPIRRIKTEKRNLLDIAIVAITVGGSAFFLIAALINYQKLRAMELPPVLHTSIPMSRIIGTGIEETPDYTLVEFGDYECPPCRANNQMVETLRSKYVGKLNFVFHHFPLNQIHPLAQEAAETAEAARKNNAFDYVHKLLMESDLDSGLFTKIKSEQHSNKQQDAAKVQQDVALGNELAISSTPSFLLCTRSGLIYKLESLSQAEDLLSKN